MKAITAVLLTSMFVLATTAAPLAKGLTEKVTIEIESVGLHPGMDPGMYVCASGHLHIKGTVQNQTGTTLGPIKVAGRAFNAAGELMGTATAATKTTRLRPGEKAEINLEFLTVTGPAIQQVKRHEVTVIEAPTL